MSELPTSAVIDLQRAHRSVRKFLDTPVTDAQLAAIIGAAQHASTSSNLQVWSVIAIRDAERKARLSAAIGNHAYVTHAPVFLVWVADLARNAELIKAQGGEPATFHLIENTLLSGLDIGIAAQSALLAAESLGLGGVFVGGIRNNPAVLSAELGLPKYAFPMVGMSIGVPDPDEGTGLKPRLPLTGVLHHEQYDGDRWKPSIEQYEESYEGYFAGQGHPGRSWARTVAKRLGTIEGMHGRHTMRDSLREQGFDSE
ncbi:MAG: NADPH-dependent oxidoreductase [Leucobacter sp.]|nr:NADPH-dependent oxidoreductase [Leucobacter sp.]